MRQYIFPVAVVESSSADAEKLLRRQTLQIGLGEQATARFEKGGHVILDFGQEMCGGVRILSASRQSTRVRIRFGESLSECCSELGGRRNATNDHGLRDLTAQLPKLSDMTLGATGFRFVRLDLEEAAQLKAVVAVNHIFKRPAIYRYGGQDMRIRQIYGAAKRTVDLCAAGDFVWDGAMLDWGATTFWEDFDLRWTKNACRIDQLPAPGQEDIHGDRGAHCYVGFRHSLCHGWSAGVLQFIKETCE